MIATLTRYIYTPRHTVGHLIAGDMLWYTLESPVEHPDPGRRCIPSGTYPLTWERSLLQPVLTLYVHAPGATGISIRTGSRWWLREGNILIGCSLKIIDESVDVAATPYDYDVLRTVLLPGLTHTLIVRDALSVPDQHHS
jgi:hypothetical protein